MLRLVDSPAHTLRPPALACITGAVGIGCTVISARARVGLVHPELFDDSTKYDASAVKLFIVNIGPVNTGAPPIAAVYHLYVKPLTGLLTLSVALPPLQTLVVAALNTGAVSELVTVTSTDVRAPLLEQLVVALVACT
jgi:hypothetical protein